MDLTPMRDVSKCAMTISGVLSAMMDGMRLMPVWLVDKQASHH